MNALSPVSADLISRLRAACIKAEQEADKENRKLFVDWIGYRLLARAEKCKPADAPELTESILLFLTNGREVIKRFRPTKRARGKS